VSQDVESKAGNDESLANSDLFKPAEDAGGDDKHDEGQVEVV
jgi:hypothetical protein